MWYSLSILHLWNISTINLWGERIFFYTLSHLYMHGEKLVGSSRNRKFKNTCKGKWHVVQKTQTLFVQMSLSDADSVRAGTILSMQMAVLSLSCYTQPLNNRILIVHDFVLIIPLSVTPIRILPVNKKTLNEFN